jgi:hypothetical protein
MTLTRRSISTIVLTLGLGAAAFAADPTGKWTASFDTQIGQQNYTYEFKVEGSTLTGTAKSGGGETAIREGRFTRGDTLFFVEIFKYQDMEIRIEYTGKIAGDEIKFTRQVAQYATEEIVAKRAK